MELPKFKYHHNPIKTGAIEKSDKVCQCCNKARGYIYTSSMYAEDDIDNICPWCISEGLAAKKFDGAFSDDYPLVEAGISQEIIDEVCQRTPGYNSWQQDVWQSHCNDACTFHGDAKKEELLALKEDALEEFLKAQFIEPKIWKGILEDYEEGGNPAVYKFVCTKCSKVIYTMDFT